MTEEVKKRGRKKGSKTGPRAIIYIAAGLNSNSDLVSKRYSSTNPEEISEEDVKTQFENDFKAIDVSVWGPFYDVKGLTQVKSIKSEPQLPVDNLELGAPKGTGVFDGWEGLVFEIKDNDQMIFYIPQKEITPSGRKLPTGKAVAVEKITMLV